MVAIIHQLCAPFFRHSECVHRDCPVLLPSCVGGHQSLQLCREFAAIFRVVGALRIFLASSTREASSVDRSKMERERGASLPTNCEQLRR